MSSGPIFISLEDYERRFKARIIAELADFSLEGAQGAADAEWEAFGYDPADPCFFQTPEDAADECMSYWEDDGDTP